MGKEDYEWYKSHKICPRCKINSAFGNYVNCAVCMEKINLENQKTRIKNGGDIYSQRYLQKNQAMKSEKSMRKQPDTYVISPMKFSKNSKKGMGCRSRKPDG